MNSIYPMFIPPINEQINKNYCLLPKLSTNQQERLHSKHHIVLLDTGINVSHPAFNNSRLTLKDFTYPQGNCHDEIGHGTHSAGILVGRDVSGFCGLIPNSPLVIAKVIGKHLSKQKKVNAISRALTWCAKHAGLIIMPLGSMGNHPTIAHIVKQLSQQHIPIFAAAGNYGRDTLLFPAILPEVFAISACNNQGKALPECYQAESHYYLAPGENIESTGLTRWHTHSGSSQACVIAAGLTVHNYLKK
ncbi:S8 family serine peptidase [Zooshikella marina]|uniref:S8 family peptidase n=1 Tax=Zooshikella ganghwensis TaxID=202772 RepID=UPI001BAF5397|nr:S8 family serine peptidase [Zooshikella ganghwensis]MBU2708547.1 S8 family serine peptidase [Zooshikella ganghwensis]